MIKKLLLGISISCLGFIGLTNGVGVYTTVGLDSVYSPVNSNYSITPLKGGAFLTNYLGISKGILALDKSRIFRRSDNGYPYVYLKGQTTTVEGFFDRYYSCDLMTGAGNSSNCSENIIDYSGTTAEIDKQIFITFFKTVTQGQKFYVNNDDYRYVGSTYQETRNAINLCRNSEEIGKSFCFKGGYCYRSKGERPGDCNFGNIINSKNLGAQFQSGLTYGLFPNERANYAPGQNGYDGSYAGNSEGAVNSNINNSITGDYVYSDCTWNDILIALEAEGYNKYVCYGGIDNFELYDPSISYNPIAGTGLSIAQIWANSSARAWDDFADWFTFWEGLYLDSSDNNYNAMWSSYPAVYHTYFQIYNSYGGGLDPRTLLEYCQLRTLTGDSLNNSAGGYFKPVCETVIREKQTGLWDCRVNGTLYSGCEQNPQVSIGTNWNGVGNMSGVAVKSDGINFIQDYFNLIKLKLQTNGFVNNFVGIIPGYIIVFLLGIILFRFISH